MSNGPNWNDASRESFREALRRTVLGEVRLAHSDPDGIMDACTYVDAGDDCPDSEWDTFMEFAADEIERASARHAAESAAWPRETDCDRLDRVEADLRDRGILLWQVSPCCDGCTMGEFPERIDEIDRQSRGFRDRVRGYCFFIEQTMADMLAESERVTVYLSYGAYPPDDTVRDVYERDSLRVAQEVCDCLRAHCLKPHWNGRYSKRIRLALTWQRRPKLT